MTTMDRTGARIVGGASSEYTFELQQLREADTVELGSVSLRALHTPGHTPEHLSFLVSTPQQGGQPFGLFTGDTLFNRAVGRPDLLGGGTEQRLATQLYRSLWEKILPLGERIEVYPGHSAGSACGRSLGDRRQSTLGTERIVNPALQPRSEAEFVAWMLDDVPEPPTYYAWLKRVNAQGAPFRGGVPVIPPLPPAAFQEQMQDQQVVVIDTRSILAFGGGHIPGAINSALRAEFPTWVGWLIDPAKRLVLVAESARDVPLIAHHVYRIGYDNLAGYLLDGMTSWQTAALALVRTGAWTVHDLHARRNDPDVLVLDVRRDDEWNAGHVPGAQHIPLPHLEERLDELDRNRRVAVYCGSGYRASIAASILQRKGCGDVINVPGSWAAWSSAQLPVENETDTGSPPNGW